VWRRLCAEGEVEQAKVGAARSWPERVPEVVLGRVEVICSGLCSSLI
jgi:hypothetical protein